MRNLLTIPAILGLLLYGFAEEELSLALPRWLHVVAVLACLLVLFKPQPLERQPIRLGVAVLVVLFGLALLRGTSRTRFLRDLYSIELGMTEAEVRAIMAGYTEGTGWGPNPLVDKVEPSGQLTIPGTLVFRHSDEWYYNSDWGTVSFEDGRVTGVGFSPD